MPQDAIMIAAPPDQPWQVTSEQVESWLRERWPEASLHRRNAGDASSLASDSSSRHGLGFDVLLDGKERHGAFHDRGQLILHDGSPEFWAEFIAWFLDRLPEGSSAFAMLEEVPDPFPMPADPTTREVIAFFRDMKSSVD